MIDVGANIGCFSVFAAFSGARKVLAIEPNKESYEVLLRNIEVNQLKDTISPIRAAISNIDNGKVIISTKSSPYNAIFAVGNSALDSVGFEEINTITLQSLIRQYEVVEIDLLKIDVEGHEFTIVPSFGPFNFTENKNY